MHTLVSEFNMFIGCERRFNTLVCEAGTDISIPHTIDPDTGERSLDIDRLVITCNPREPVLPTPTYSWTKDRMVVLRETTRGSADVMIADGFLMEGNNSLLALINPVPIMLTSSLGIEVDFTATNITLPGGGMTTSGDIRQFILNIILGEWQCSISNAFGNDSRTSIVFGELFVFPLPSPFTHSYCHGNDLGGQSFFVNMSVTFCCHGNDVGGHSDDTDSHRDV